MNEQLTPKEEAYYLVQHFFFELKLRDYQDSKNCAIYLSHMLIRETLDINRIKHWKEVVSEIEKS